MSSTYHGPTPVTAKDKAMARTHLKETIALKRKELALNNKKISQHRQAAKATANPKSKSYNKSHVQGHVKDNAKVKKDIRQRQTSMRTLSKLHPR